MAYPSKSSSLDFVIVEEAGLLEIEYQGPPLDMHTLGIVHLNLQDIVDRMAFAALRAEELIGPYWQRKKYEPAFRPQFESRIVKAQPTKIQIDSLLEQIMFLAPAVLADPNVRAVLQGFAANIIFAVACSQFYRWSGFKKVNQELPHRIPRVDISSNIRPIVLVLAENGGGTLKLKSQSPNGQILEVEIRADGQRR